MRFIKRSWIGLTLALCLVSSLVWAASRFTDLSALTTAASGDFVPIVDVSDTTDDAAGSSRKITLTNLATFFWTAPSFTAGSATAGSWPKFNSGTVLTTAEAGAIEYDGTTLYATVDAGNRGVLSVCNFLRQDTTYTLTSQTAAQKLFNASTNGRVTLETGTYLLDAFVALTSMSATSGNATFSLDGGTATLGTVLWRGFGRDIAADGATGTLAGSWSADSTLVAAPLVTAATNTAMVVELRGTFEVTVAGTVQPRISLQTAAAAVVSAGSYVRICRMGDTSATVVGEWD